ncbi:MAG: PD-(D/E)XK nuclease family protein, partial [bacterium]|nr:PD-(D/E)XK nuclease family protein [bacterium]
GIEQKVIQYLHKKGKARIIWHGHPEEWEKVLKPLAHLFQGELEVIKGKEKPGTNNINIYSGTDLHSQVMGVRQVLSREKLKDTVIVLPLADTLFPLLSYGIENLRKEKVLDQFNISMGYPLNRTSFFTLMNQILEIQKFTRNRDRKGMGPLLYPGRQYMDILSSPFIKNMKNDLVRPVILAISQALAGGLEKSPLKGLTLLCLQEIHKDKELLKAVRESSGITDEAMISQTIQMVHTRFFHDFEDIRTLEGLCERMEQLIDHILLNSEVRSYILSGEVFNRFFAAMNEIRKTSLSREELEKELVLDLFLFSLNHENISFETKPLQEMEIIGMLETRNLNFRNVVMLDVQEGVMPAEKKIDPLVPAGLYSVLGLPDHEKNQEMYRYYFTRLVRGAENVHLFYIQDESKQRSRYIEELIWKKEKEEKRLNALAVRKIFFPVRLISRQEKEIVIPKGNVILSKLKKMSYSASGLDSYLRCRLKFYFEKVLGLKEEKKVREDIDQAERGILVHRILRDTFLPFMGQDLESRKYPEMESHLLKTIEKHFQAQPSTGEYYLFRKITENHLKNFLKKDLERKTPFRVLHLEKKWETHFPVNGQEVVLKGFIDRVDTMRDRVVIFDYKTGSLLPGDSVDPDADIDTAEKIREHISSFQLPVYIRLFLDNEPAAKLENLEAVFISVLDSTEKFLFTGRSLASFTREKIYTDFYLKALTNLLQEILDPEVPFTRYKDTDCRDCPFIHLCGMEEEEREY